MRPIDVDKLKKDIHSSYSDDLEILSHIDKIPTIDWASYSSPIDIITKEIVAEYEEAILRTINSCSIKVDKEELIKALNYDRNQYEIGYKAGYQKAREELGL